jgi:2-methylisocitrate lyase-like PEP mutase family enzyme
MANPIIRDKLDRKEFFVAPGVQDMITAAICNKTGFEIVYGTGYWMTASCLGLPDAGIATYTQMLDRMATLARTSNAAVIADADTGYGGLLNVHHTVRGYEDAGITAIQLEDQEFPKKCGHTPYKRVIPAADMVEKIRVAAEARIDRRNFLIIARTDARASEGLDAALRRLDAYREAGADILFLEAPQSEEEMRIACRAMSAPMMANMADGGLTPILPADQLRDIGYAFAIYPSMTSLVAAAAMEQALLKLKQSGLSQTPEIPMFDFKEFCGLIGFNAVWEFERRWRPGGDHLGRPFGERDHRAIGIAAGDAGHDRGVDDPKAGKAVDPEHPVDHILRPRPHAAGAGRMPVERRRRAEKFQPRGVAHPAGPWRVKPSPPVLDGRRRQSASAQQNHPVIGALQHRDGNARRREGVG